MRKFRVDDVLGGISWASGVAGMMRLRQIAVVAALVLASTVSYAFEEQQKPAAGAAAPSMTVPSLDAKSLGLSPGSLTPPKGDSGTKIRIPGLGVIGEIPKIDFGMELLYGATQPRPLESDRNDASGMMLRGKMPIQSR